MSRFRLGFTVALVGAALWTAAPPRHGRAEELAMLPSGLDSGENLADKPIFGRREIHVAGIGQFYKWTDMLARWAVEVAQVDACAVAASALSTCVPEEWASLTERLKGLAPRAMLDEVNRAINAHPYVSSLDNWGTADHWETPFEFMSRNGQCEDYAIAKFMILRAMGFANDQLRIVVLRDEARQVDHAVLVAILDNQAWLLDSLSDDVAAVVSSPQYRAYYSINETGWWLALPNPIAFSAGFVARIASH